MSIITKGLTKTYGSITAVNGVSLELPEGVVLGMLGPNGAGKTTLLKMLTTITKPTAGTASVHGYDVLRQGLEVRRVIGVVAQENYTDSFLTVRENLVVHAKMHGMSPAEYNPRIDELLHFMGLEGRQKDKPKTFSTGMLRRLVLIRALVHNPKILFLDEPTTGLDPQARRAIWDYLDTLRGKVTVFLTTHYMEEADTLCDRVAIIDFGSILVDGPPSRLKEQISDGQRYEIELKGDPRNYAPLVQKIAGVKSYSIKDSTLLVELSENATIKTVLEPLPEEAVSRVAVQRPSLEDVFLRLTGRALRD